MSDPTSLAPAPAPLAQRPPRPWSRWLAVSPAQDDKCPNCASPFPDPKPKYCGECGQETLLRAPKLGEFLQQFGGSYLAMEGALWRTLAKLMVPGQLTLEYFAGRRRRYVLPLRIYLTISLLALILLRIVTATQMETASADFIKIDTADKKDVQIIGMGGFEAGIKDGVFFCKKLPTSTCERLKRRFNFDPATMATELQEGQARFFSHLGTAMFLLLPSYALWLKLVYLDKRRRYTEHLIYALHLHAFWFAMIALVMAGKLMGLSGAPAWAGLASMLYPLVAMSRVYRSRWWSTGLRAFAVLLLYSITISMALAGLMVWTLLS
ncbi:DUF3667 domain-containing protein [Roseateles sp. PN1]|uniref:DUF3667 domain-containing protein n=1 Tax=Roseateles sp. PN1 TaxID=3137372 RepID=UPI0031398E73